MAYKVVKNVDKFNDKTTLTMNKAYKLSTNLGVVSHGAKLMIRHLSMPDVDSLLIDYYYETTDNVEDYLYLDGREMILRINDRENIALPFIGEGMRDSYVYEDSNGAKHHTTSEYNYVEIDKITLEKICNAASLEIKINGLSSKEYNANKCQKFIEYCKIFHNGLYNSDINSIQNALPNSNLDKTLVIVIIGTIGLAFLLLMLFFLT